ncbi:MAG TPA: RlmE family RNA methyltransferase [Candidatus Binataceae bacterium]|nr:RlmE family RNA methyltransferase [Candidatus Binataceae bacterium]
MATYEPHDRFYRKAREKGLPSRAAFKLEEILARHRLAPAGARVIDLGCAPGGWLAILAQAVGPTGRVVGIDLASCKNFGPVTISIAGDILDPEVLKRACDALGGRADLVTSDLSPKLSGIADRDQARSRELLNAAIGVAQRALRPDGAMVAKLFMGGEFKEAVNAFEHQFKHVEVVRTRASRPGSSELYVIARGMRLQSP